MGGEGGQRRAGDGRWRWKEEDEIKECEGPGSLINTGLVWGSGTFPISSPVFLSGETTGAG